MFEETTLDSMPGSAMAVYYGPESGSALTLVRRGAFGEEIPAVRRAWRLADDSIEIDVEVAADGTDDWAKVAGAVFDR